MYILMIFVATQCSAAKIKDIPFDTNLYLGLTSGLGTGISIGFDLEYPLNGYKLGFEFGQLVTNTLQEQNINISKFGLIYKQNIGDDFFLSLHLGTAPYYHPKEIEYQDIYTGKTYTLPADNRGKISYLGLGLNFLAGEYIITPKFSYNTIDGEGTVLETSINIGRKL